LLLSHISDRAPSFLVASCDPLKAERRRSLSARSAGAFSGRTRHPRKHCWIVTMHDLAMFLIGIIAGNAIVLLAMRLI
jgi:hypothetical protein